MIHNSIEFIENHLEEELNLDRIAKEAGFSKYHFHRLFQKYVGKSLAEYIRSRRLSSAAQLLLYSEERILDIALLYGFDSQEAFTRAFKGLYALPPAQYRSQIKLLIQEREELTMSEIKGWFITGTSPSKYKASLDMQIYHKGRNSVSLECAETEPPEENEFGTLMQQFDAKNYLGKRMRFAGFIRTEEVSDWCGLWMRIDDKLQNMLGFDNMQYRSIKGTASWNFYACVLDIPAEADCINIGILLSGSGKIWLDDCTFEEVGLDVPVTDSRARTEEFPTEPQNLKFEA
ncbi:MULTISPECIES: helix-turn-helix domain-containing protein [Paenibacillus]|jgi:AraC-like DNA-binding protein|uniref:AraC family transcriptional regulator n=1 Tax=Paenibacillus odorifer TaxID=189426 RepID=A0ABX3GZ03_9BACL|nr:helix-turn-helix domain-containing protein [Paenibacillus odorifer]OMD40916.1 AraC family transcriptional regulator [Paenibacillus odorifer]